MSQRVSPRETAAPEELFARYRDLLGEVEWRAMCEAFARPLPPTLWVSPRRALPAEVLSSLRADGHAPRELPWLAGAAALDAPARLGRRLEFRAGLMHTQEAASMLPPLALDPRPGEVVLDLCAAPGGKTAQLSLMMGGRGTLVANDLSFARLSALRATQERLGLSNMVLCAQEGERLLRDHPPCFDKVLVDAPCSCEGTIRKRGGWSFEGERGDFRAALRATQERLLLNALRLTKRGGRVVYSTCTLDPAENEGSLSGALSRFGGAVEVEPLALPGLRVEPGLRSFGGERFREEAAGAARVYPHHNDTGGFFIASLRVTAPERQEEADPYARWRRAGELPPARDEELLGWAEGHLGLPRDSFEGLRLTQGCKRVASVVNAELLVPPTRVEVAGLPTFHTRGRLPHLTTGASVEWGRRAARQVVTLTAPAQVDAYYRGEEQPLPPEARDAAGALRRGDVIVCFASPHHAAPIPLGTGFCAEEGGALTLGSLYPKARALAPHASAFEGPVVSEEGEEGEEREAEESPLGG